MVHCNAPAQSWSADFKGDVPLANGKRCYPLTLTDNHSRFILQCRALSHPTTDAVKPWFEWVFREYGLPETLRTDNGPPFASVAAGGLSQLSKWWIRQGAVGSIQVQEMTEAVPGIVRAGRPRSQGAFVHTIHRERGFILSVHVPWCGQPI